MYGGEPIREVGSNATADPRRAPLNPYLVRFDTAFRELEAEKDPEKRAKVLEALAAGIPEGQLGLALAVLTDPELELLRDASPSERGHLMWVAACRRYAFIGDFAEEVVRERFLLLTPTLGYDDFDSFVRGKALWHPELAEVKDSTLQKLRSTVFRMLTEAGLLAGGEIVNAALSERVRDALDAQLPSDLRYLPARDTKEVSL